MGARDDDDESTLTSSRWSLTPVLMMYYLCCWPTDSKSDTSSEIQSRRTAIRHDHAPASPGPCRRRAGHVCASRIGSSAVSLHLPGTSGDKKDALAAHRSHEEIGRRKSHHELSAEESARHHSAPSVIDEVLHRRDWDRSNRELYIPLKPELLNDAHSISSDSLERAPRAEPESSSDDNKTDERIAKKPCKKHYKNIKSSKGKKEVEVEEKDRDATEVSSFYIGDNDAGVSASPRRDDILAKSIYKAKEAKQCFNECIRSKDRPRQMLVPVDEHQRVLGFCLDDVIDQLETLDRSGAMHHSIESRISLSKPAFPPPSVEPTGYEGGACYLPAGGERGGAAPLAVSALRARHASDGDILAPPHRPESGAFSESDLDLELEGTEELPPAYDELPLFASPQRKETAI